jgi:hypothetical protein
MPKPFKHWTVLPHGKLTRVEENIFYVVGAVPMPLMKIERRMTVVRLRDGRLVVYSAIALDESEMQALEQLGVPAYLVVPNDIHRIDVKAWKDRYPAIAVVTPPAARAKVEKVVHVDTTSVDFDDPAVHFVVVPGTGEREAALVVETSSGTTIVLNDLIFDLVARPGLSGWLMKAMGMTGDRPHVPPIIKLRQVKDKEALRAQLGTWSRLPNLKRVIISHGTIITDHAAEVLGRISEDLAA